LRPHETMQGTELYIARRGTSSKQKRCVHDDPDCEALCRSPNVDTATEWEREHCKECPFCIGGGAEQDGQDWSAYEAFKAADSLEDLRGGDA